MILGFVSVAHPDLRFVDFISFANRARRISHGQDLLNGLYPVGYPSILLILQPLFGDVLLAGKLLAVGAGGLAVASVARLCGVSSALWLLALPPLLTWGSTEGTDLPAAALALASLAAAVHGRSALAGVLVGAACLTRYTALAAVLPVLLLVPARGRMILSFLAVTSPHWGAALWLGRSPLPDQGENVMMAAGGPVGAFSRENLSRWPASFLRAMGETLSVWPAAVGAVGLIVGLIRKQRAAFALALLGLGHLALVALAFSNPRLVLPATLAFGAGVTWLLPGRINGWLWLPAAGLLATALPAQRERDRTEQNLAALNQACTSVVGPVLSNSPWFYLRRDGWLETGDMINHLNLDPHRVEPAGLLVAAQGFRALALEVGRLRSNPGLKPLSRDPLPDGYTLVCKAPGWRVLGLGDASNRKSAPLPGR